MNKFAVSLGFIALGTSALHAVESSALNDMQATKPWSVAASLRGFYDSNIDTIENGQSSWGYEIAPELHFGLAGEQTSFNLGYLLSAKYYEQQPLNQNGKWTLTQTANLGLTHTFNPRLSMNVTDSFVLGQEPDQLRAANLPLSTAQVVSGDNIVNYGSIGFNYVATELLGLRASYNNAYYNYKDDQPTYIPAFPTPIFASASNAGLLNRVDNQVVLDSEWKLNPQTTGILGYTYGQSVYTADQQILTLNTGQAIYSDNKNRRSHTVYAGAQQTFTPNLSGLLKGGATYSDYYGDPTAQNNWTPYVMADLKYQFQTTTTFDIGLLYTLSAANYAGQQMGTDYIRDQDSTLFYGSLTHELIAHLVSTFRATVQNATYNGGGPSVDGQGYVFYELGFDLAYEFTKNISAHVGYNYDNNNSDIAGQSYDRNRVYLGVTGSY